jgi:hypothetical protein
VPDELECGGECLLPPLSTLQLLLLTPVLFHVIFSYLHVTFPKFGTIYIELSLVSIVDKEKKRDL